ncbi:MAG TPA: MarR family transcriptional regulator [Paraburkholderia sp.]|uniref:MarR family winged helix-turn-helix transcriptional regulator n=1 Tax=Paraburkholderia sp. TaxID=1926495 RepID=UPI002CA4D6C5|nr:MarR family transcriptional regulator [Paraburkholderia sp.]HTR09279.1 MarR family transcriptional regulator [Paraburkholderia sp.]
MAKLTTNDLTGERSPSRLLRRIHRLLVTRVDSLFDDEHLTLVQWTALKLIRDGTVTTAGELSRSMGIATGATTRLIDSLEELGYVKRDLSSSDRRVVRLVLTKSGEAKHAERVPVMVASWNEILADFKKQEAEELIRLLAKLHDSMERVIETNSRGDGDDAD